MKSNLIKAHLALLGANTIYGINHIVAKNVMPDKIGPSAFIFLRIFFAGIMFWIIKSFIKEKIELRDYPRLILCGFLGVATNMLFFFHGLNLTSPVDASIIMTSGPIMVLFFSAIILKEGITKNKIGGIVLGAFGSILLIAYGNASGGTSSLLGNALIFINACSYALYLVMVKPLMHKYKALNLISWVFLFGFIFMFPFGIGDLVQTDFSAFETSTFLSISFVIIGTTFLAYLFNIYALNYVSPTVNSSYIFLQPAVSFIIVALYTVMFGSTVYADDINPVKIACCALVVAGVYLISKQEKD